MRRTWVEDSRERKQRRRVSLNALCLEQLEDRLTLSHTPAPWAVDLALAPSVSASETRPAIFPQAMFPADTRLAVERLAGASDDVRMDFKPVPTYTTPISTAITIDTTGPIVSPLPVIKAPWSGIEIIPSPGAKLPSIGGSGDYT